MKKMKKLISIKKQNCKKNFFPLKKKKNIEIIINYNKKKKWVNSSL